MRLGLSLGLVQIGAAASGPTPPPEWGGVVPIADWDLANAVIDTGTVVSVPDASGHANDLTAVSGQKPPYDATDASFNDLPTMSFPDGGVFRLTFGDLGVASGGPVWIFAVASSDSATSHNNYLLSSSGGELGLYEESAGGTWAGWLTTTGLPNIYSSAPGDVSVIELKKVSGTQSIYVNSTSAAATDTSLGLDLSSGGMVGNYAPAPLTNFALRGSVARIIVFDVAPNEAAVMNALGAIYGIAIS